MWRDFAALSRYLSRKDLPALAPLFDARKSWRSNSEELFFTNPSIACCNGNMLLSLRVMNNPIQLKSYLGTRTYKKPAKSGIELLTLNSELVEIDRSTVVDPNSSSSLFADARIFLVAGMPHYIGTYQAPDGYISPAILNPKGAIIPMERPFGSRSKDKNWVPVAGGPEGYFLCQSVPPLVGEFCLETGRLRRALAQSRIEWGDSMPVHGGAGPVRIAGGWLAICRERLEVPRAGLVYVQRALFLDEDFNLARISGPWVVDGLGIEIVNGAAIAHGRLYLSWGRDDREAHAAHLPLAAAVEWFRQIDGHPLRDLETTKLRGLMTSGRVSDYLRLLLKLNRTRLDFNSRSDLTGSMMS